MNSRLALSLLFILIAGMVLASQGSGFREKVKTFPTFWADKISQTQSLMVLYHCSASTRRPHPTTVNSTEGKTVISDTPNVIGSHTRYLQRFVQNLVSSDQQGE